MTSQTSSGVLSGRSSSPSQRLVTTDAYDTNADVVFDPAAVDAMEREACEEQVQEQVWSPAMAPIL